MLSDYSARFGYDDEVTFRKFKVGLREERHNNLIFYLAIKTRLFLKNITNVNPARYRAIKRTETEIQLRGVMLF